MEQKHGYKVHNVLVYTVYPDRAADVYRFGRFLSMARNGTATHNVRCHLIGEAVMPFIQKEQYEEADIYLELVDQWKQTIELGLTTSLCEAALRRRMAEKNIPKLLEQWQPMELVDIHEGPMKLLGTDKAFMI